MSMGPRQPFSKETQDAITIAKGEHRRHIISHHLMQSALNIWINSNGANRQTIQLLQERLYLMNNYLPNLHPGDGKVNTAIGMFTNNASRTAEAQKFDSPKSLEEKLNAFRGFEINTQKSLVSPVLTAFSNDAMISATKESAVRFAFDLVDSTDFDWPKDADANLWHDWSSVYQMFLSIKSNPTNWTESDLLGVIDQVFLQLKNPCT